MWVLWNVYLCTEILDMKMCGNPWIWKQDGTDVDIVSKSAKNWRVFQRATWGSDRHGDWSVFLSLERLLRQRAVWHRWAQFNISNNLSVLSVLLQKVPFVAGQNVVHHLHHKRGYSRATHSYSLLTIDVAPVLLSLFTKRYLKLRRLKTNRFIKLLFTLK